MNPSPCRSSRRGLWSFSAGITASLAKARITMASASARRTSARLAGRDAPLVVVLQRQVLEQHAGVGELLREYSVASRSRRSSGTFTSVSAACFLPPAASPVSAACPVSALNIVVLPDRARPMIAVSIPSP